MEQELIDAISMVKSSHHRCSILIVIGNNIMTPSDISKNTGIRLNHISMLLGELKEQKLIICLNESAKKGRLYQLTELGKKVIEITGSGVING